MEHNLFVVFGASKSGTTWLQKLLNSHPEIDCYFQYPLFPFLSPPFDSNIVTVHDQQKSPFKGVFKTPIEEKKYWTYNTYLKGLRKIIQSYVKDLKSKGHDIDYLQHLASNIHKGYVLDILGHSNSKVIGTKAYTDFELLFKLFPNAKVVTIMRDGRDVCVSKRFHYQKYGIYFHGDEKFHLLFQLNKNIWFRKVFKKLNRRLGVFDEQFYDLNKRYKKRKIFTPDALSKIATEWERINNYILKWKSKKPDNILNISYEDLKKSPKTTLEQCLNFLDVNKQDQIISEIVSINDFKNLQKGKKDSFYRKGKVGDWRNYFTEYDKQQFKEIAGDMLITLGYEENHDW